MGDLFYNFIWTLGSPAFMTNGSATLLHRERVKRPGPFILASTHLSVYDVPLLIRHTPRILDFVSIVEAFRHPLAAWFLGTMGAFPLDRAKADSPTVRIILERLARGRVIAMFPEGTIRNERNSLLAGGPMKPGFIRMAKLANVPIIPCVVLGAGQYHHLKSWMPLRRTRYGIAYGEAIEIDRKSEEADQARIEAELRKAYVALFEELKEAMGEQMEGSPKPEVKSQKKEKAAG
ncbi:MAG TPA: lysophospholipid acyltransferase family protein [Humisphaera sp.]|nr:lysophospholipid acyltransferase family protein [Humisphaera sp.]